MHLHPAYQDYRIYHEDKPTIIARSEGDTRLKKGDLPVTEAGPSRTYSIPRFGYCDEEYITQCAAAYRKVMEHADEVPIEEGDYDEEGLAREREFRG